MSDLHMTQPLTDQWQALIGQPLSFVREQAVVDCFDRPVSPEQMTALRESRRFDARIERQLIGHFRLQPLNQIPTPDAADLAVLLLAEADMQRLPRVCGAVWHAATLSREIRSEVVNEYRQALGVDTLSLALRLRQLAGAADLLRTPAALLQAIDRDGAACMGAWLAAQPEALREWLQLRLDAVVPAGAQPATDERHVQVVRSVASELAAARAAMHERGNQADE